MDGFGVAKQDLQAHILQHVKGVVCIAYNGEDQGKIPRIIFDCHIDEGGLHAGYHENKVKSEGKVNENRRLATETM